MHVQQRGARYAEVWSGSLIVLVVFSCLGRASCCVRIVAEHMSDLRAKQHAARARSVVQHVAASLRMSQSLARQRQYCQVGRQADGAKIQIMCRPASRPPKGRRVKGVSDARARVGERLSQVRLRATRIDRGFVLCACPGVPFRLLHGRRTWLPTGRQRIVRRVRFRLSTDTLLIAPSSIADKTDYDGPDPTGSPPVGAETPGNRILRLSPCETY